ncbi:MAG: hypothetical protein BJG00_015115 [Limnothrix sp. CACIAM 69d]|nr:MAG: hypothetical protein BJG00_015115 [Limnothrix sp. CACIAM 69d]
MLQPALPPTNPKILGWILGRIHRIDGRRAMPTTGLRSKLGEQKKPAKKWEPPVGSGSHLIIQLDIELEWV